MFNICKISFIPFVVTLTKKDKLDNWGGVKRKVVNNNFACSLAFTQDHCYEIKETCRKYVYTLVYLSDWIYTYYFERTY